MIRAKIIRTDTIEVKDEYELAKFVSYLGEHCVIYSGQKLVFKGIDYQVINVELPKAEILNTNPKTESIETKELKLTAIGCPKCGESMVKRVNKDGIEFLGCIRYPECRGSRNMNGSTNAVTKNPRRWRTENMRQR